MQGKKKNVTKRIKWYVENGRYIYKKDMTCEI